MPLAKMRSMGPEFWPLDEAEVNSSLRLAPDQNSFSKVSLCALTRLRANSLRKIADQLDSDTSISSAMTICTTKLACSTSWRMFRSWFMVKAQGVFSKNSEECGSGQHFAQARYGRVQLFHRAGGGKTHKLGGQVGSKVAPRRDGHMGLLHHGK